MTRYPGLHATALKRHDEYDEGSALGNGVKAELTGDLNQLRGVFEN